jgi:hypothetical protein
MKRPDMSWRPTTGQLTTTALAIVCLLVGFWIGWQHRSSSDPQTVTPSVPANMRTRNVIVLPTTAAPATVTTAPTTTGTTPAVPLPPRSQIKVAVLNAGTTSGVAVQIAVSIVQQGYPTPLTGNVTLPPSLVPTQTGPSTVPQATATTTAGPATHTTTAAPPPTTSTATTPPAVPQIIYYRSGDQGIAARLGADLGITDIAPAPASAALQAAAPTAQLIVVVGNP